MEDSVKTLLDLIYRNQKDIEERIKKIQDVELALRKEMAEIYAKRRLKMN